MKDEENERLCHCLKPAAVRTLLHAHKEKGREKHGGTDMKTKGKKTAVNSWEKGHLKKKTQFTCASNKPIDRKTVGNYTLKGAWHSTTKDGKTSLQDERAL